MYKNNSAATRSTSPDLTAFMKGFGDSHVTREHCVIYHDVRRLLSRRAKAFLKLLEGQLPDDVMKYVATEIAAETRSNQNMMAQQLFNFLIVSAQFCKFKDARLRIKFDELAEMICMNIDSNDDDRYDN